jgi:ParB family chromosome partitioning protein
MIPVASIRPGKFQPRRRFETEEMEELTASVRAHGVLQPVLLRRHPKDATAYEIIAGERRWRAAQAASIHEIPAVVRELDDRGALEAALVENLQREDLSAIEEARAFRRLMDEFGHTQEKIAAALGKSRPYVANAVRLLELPDDVQGMIDRGALSAGHGRLLVGRADATLIAADWARSKISVREAEAMLQAVRAPKTGARGKGAGKRGGAVLLDANTVDLERRLTSALGCKVRILHQKDTRSGIFQVFYQTLDQLDDIIERVGGTDRDWKKPANWSAGLDKK